MNVLRMQLLAVSCVNVQSYITVIKTITVVSSVLILKQIYNFLNVVF